MNPSDKSTTTTTKKTQNPNVSILCHHTSIFFFFPSFQFSFYFFPSPNFLLNLHHTAQPPPMCMFHIWTKSSSPSSSHYQQHSKQRHSLHRNAPPKPRHTSSTRNNSVESRLSFFFHQVNMETIILIHTYLTQYGK